MVRIHAIGGIFFPIYFCLQGVSATHPVSVTAASKTVQANELFGLQTLSPSLTQFTTAIHVPGKIRVVESVRPSALVQPSRRGFLGGLLGMAAPRVVVPSAYIPMNASDYAIDNARRDMKLGTQGSLDPRKWLARFLKSATPEQSRTVRERIMTHELVFHAGTIQNEVWRANLSPFADPSRFHSLSLELDGVERLEDSMHRIRHHFALERAFHLYDRCVSAVTVLAEQYAIGAVSRDERRLPEARAFNEALRLIDPAHPRWINPALRAENQVANIAREWEAFGNRVLGKKARKISLRNTNKGLQENSDPAAMRVVADGLQNILGRMVKSLGAHSLPSPATSRLLVQSL